MDANKDKHYILVIEGEHTEAFSFDTLSDAKRHALYFFKDFKEIRYKETVIYNDISIDGITGTVRLLYKY